MEIRNNTPMMNRPAFGMAFKKPSPELMEDFVDYVGCGKSGNRVKKALVKLQEQQAGNKHFDIITVKDGDKVAFKVVPKIDAEKAKKMHGDGEVFTQSVDSEILPHWRQATKKNNAAREALGEKPSFVRRAFVETGCFFRELFAEVKAAANPMTELPGSLQAAAKKATQFESNVDYVIKKEETIRSAFKP